jgi:hypothetical protein
MSIDCLPVASFWMRVARLRQGYRKRRRVDRANLTQALGSALEASIAGVCNREHSQRVIVRALISMIAAEHPCQRKTHEHGNKSAEMVIWKALAYQA